MEENPKRRSHEASRAAPPVRSTGRFQVDVDFGDQIECSGKYCRSCTGGVIADCVAVCCCPCAVVTFLALAVVKLPWVMGKRCLGLGKKKVRRLEKVGKCEGKCGRNETDLVVYGEGMGNGKKGSAGEGNQEDASGLENLEGIGERMEGLNARFEAERVWLELYQLGHVGFGRLSFTGIPPQG